MPESVQGPLILYTRKKSG